MDLAKQRGMDSRSGRWGRRLARRAGFLAAAGVALAGSAASAAPASCSPSPTALCLSSSRFRVEVEWRASSSASFSAGQAVPITSDTGYFWFFQPENIELVVKVLNGCALNGQYWVFASGLTNVEVDIAVTDTATGG